MAQLNWRPGMWPPPEFGWEYPNPMLAHMGVVGGPMKRTPSNLSMSAVPDGMHPMWPPHMMHPMMYPGFHPSMMYLSGSQSQLMGTSAPGPMMMMNSSNFEQRPPSPASSQRSRRSNQRSSQQRSSHKQSRSSASKASDRWSDSDDDFSRESDDSIKERPKSPRAKTSSLTRPSSKTVHKDYSSVSMSSVRLSPKPKADHTSLTKTTLQAPPSPQPPQASQAPQIESNEAKEWECAHCTFMNTPDTRICVVCCRTSDHGAQAEAADEEELPVVMSNLSFSIKEERSRDAVPVQLKSEISKDKSPARTVSPSDDARIQETINQNYEDVSNMLKRLRTQREEPTKREPSQKREPAKQEAHLKEPQRKAYNPLLDELDAVEDEEADTPPDEDEERYIEMEEKEPVYEHVNFPADSEANITNASSASYVDHQGNFEFEDYLQAAERVRRARFQYFWS